MQCMQDGAKPYKAGTELRSAESSRRLSSSVLMRLVRDVNGEVRFPQRGFS